MQAVTSSATVGIDHAPQSSPDPVKYQMPVVTNIILNQTRLHTLVQKVPGAIEFTKQVSRNNVPLYERVFEMEDAKSRSELP